MRAAMTLYVMPFPPKPSEAPPQTDELYFR